MSVSVLRTLRDSVVNKLHRVRGGLKFSLGFLFVLSLFVIENENTQAGGRDKVWIFFTERIAQHHPAGSKNLKSFSNAAISRRLRRAEIPFDESDLPVQKQYIDAVQRSGATVLIESRWLHAVSARCDASCRDRVSRLRFVTEIRPVRTYFRPLEPISPAPSGAEPLAAAAEKALRYGKSKEQLNQIKVPFLHKKGFAGQGEIVAVFDGGFRKDHAAFKKQTVLAERDFVFGDDNVTNGSTTDSHGTATWSCVGGEAPGKLYGAAYRSQFLLAATEDIRGETIVEEDNWVAGFEWADQNGASVISSSLGYSDWYTQSDYNGVTAITSKVVSKAAKKGIVVVNSAGNSGPGPSTLVAPSDAKNMISVGAVNFLGAIAGFSSRGPTADGRIKPEVVARGVSTFVATSSSTNSFGRSSGTSFSCPLVAGAVATLLSAHPDWKPVQVREALLETASQSQNPDNTYGWGIVDLFAASEYLPKKSVVIDEHTPLKNSSNTSNPYRATARIRAQRGINPAQLFLFWKKEGDSTFQKVPFAAIAGKPDQFEAFIPGQPRGTTVLYYLGARDIKGKATTLPFPAPSSTFQFRIL